MKRRYSIVVVLMALFFSSCDSWLDVEPELDIYEETLFEKANGYYVALNGLYIKMSESDLYGKELSWGGAEAWGRSYILDEDYHKGYIQIANFEYEKVEAVDLAKNLWLKSFKVIAETNNLIQNLEQDKDVVFKHGEVTKNMILGEAYAIRALMHFELLRIFAKAPVADNGGTSAFVPYVTTYPALVNTPLATKEVLSKIIADMERAKDLIKPFDTDARYPGYACFSGTSAGMRIKLDNGVEYPHNEENFFSYRANRLNYYAVTALLSRVCLYAGDKDKAFTSANEIVELVNSGLNYVFVSPTRIGDPVNKEMVEPRLHSEMLFGSYNSHLEDWTEPYFDNTRLMRMLLVVGDKNGIFADNLNDVRLAAIPRNVITKFSLVGKNESDMNAAKSLIPVIRFPECFYIAAESVFEKDKGLAVRIFNQAVEARGNAVYVLGSESDKETFMEAIIREYRREFLGEGQLVYLYKRLNIPLRANGTTVQHNGKLVMPIPDIEAGI